MSKEKFSENCYVWFKKFMGNNTRKDSMYLYYMWSLLGIIVLETLKEFLYRIEYNDMTLRLNHNTNIIKQFNMSETSVYIMSQ